MRIDQSVSEHSIGPSKQNPWRADFDRRPTLLYDDPKQIVLDTSHLSPRFESRKNVGSTAFTGTLISLYALFEAMLFYTDGFRFQSSEALRSRFR